MSCSIRTKTERNKLRYKIVGRALRLPKYFYASIVSYQTVGQRILWIQSYNLEYFKRICNVVILTENRRYFADLANAVANSNRFARFCWTLFVVATILVRVIDLSPFQQQQQQFKRCMAGSSDDDTHTLSLLRQRVCVRAFVVKSVCEDIEGHHCFSWHCTMCCYWLPKSAPLSVSVLQRAS